MCEPSEINTRATAFLDTVKHTMSSQFIRDEFIRFGLDRPPPKRHIHNRFELSFVLPNSENRLNLPTASDWHVPDQPVDWNNAYKWGGRLFSEVRRLARSDKNEAVTAIRLALDEIVRYGRCGGVEAGFIDRLARCAVIDVAPHQHNGDVDNA